MASLPITRLGADVLIVITVFLVGAMVAVGLRLWSIRIIRRPYRTHDYLILLALVPTVHLSARAAFSKMWIVHLVWPYRHYLPGLVTLRSTTYFGSD